MSKDFLTVLSGQVLIADGAIGTLLQSRGLVAGNFPTSSLNIARSSFVQAIHAEYIEAGAQLIETNTYGAIRPQLERFGLADQVQAINLAGAKNALKAKRPGVWVAGAVGPVGRKALKQDKEEIIDAYREQVQALADGGVDLFMLETFYDLDDLGCALEGIVRTRSGLPIIASMAFSLQGTTVAGVSVRRMLASLKHSPCDVIGVNCGGGEATAARVIEELRGATHKPLCALPNRGLADFDENGRAIYTSSSKYFATQGLAMVEKGVNIIGGCCGTTPADIAELAKAIGKRAPVKIKPRTSSGKSGLHGEASRLTAQKSLTSLRAKQNVVVIAEVDPPRGMDCSRELKGARKLLEAGVDSLTIADNPLSVMRMSNLAFASILIKETGANITLHLACRDRNTLGNQSHLLGAAALGITNVLAITGDPMATEAYQRSSGVFDMSSLNLIRMIDAMREDFFLDSKGNTYGSGFCIGGAFNSAIRSLEAEGVKTKRKQDAGMSFVMTQPVYDLERAHQILDLLEPLGLEVFLGVMPLVSERNAEFLHNEVPGISIPDRVRERMAGKSGPQGRAQGVKLAQELIAGFIQRCPGVYLITPMNCYSMIAELARFSRSFLELNPAKSFT